MVCDFECRFQLVFSPWLVQLPGSNFLPSSGSSRRAAIPSSHDPAAMTVGDSEPPRLRTIDASAGSFQKISSGQRNSSILSENKRQSSGRNSSNVKNLESALRGIESLHFSNDERPHY
ncbi:hypothetical protein HRI_005168700 [Hibiscus trionum]|uniref:Uncharacterized protein n=1 Tax=Hibiscus trionum TaxID=183268 RepID=A0A9W7MWK4_HIBTR|nr:hypothetical protein HRI_005168700 [Hibiscus trionum]